MNFRRQRSTIDEVAQVVGTVQNAWAEGKLAGIQLMDIKDAFDQVSPSCLLRTM